MQVLAARGSELERAFSYGGAAALEPFLARLRGRSEPSARGRGGARDAAVRPRPARGPAGDRFVVGNAARPYWLAANVAASRPLLLAVDDLHWCDLPSLRWLAYVLPRMEGLGLVIVVGLRLGEPGEDPGLLGQIVSTRWLR